MSEEELLKLPRTPAAAKEAWKPGQPPPKYIDGSTCLNGHTGPRYACDRSCVECKRENSATKSALRKARREAAGAATYMSDTPCKRGHVGERYVYNNNCCECNREGGALRTDSAAEDIVRMAKRLVSKAVSNAKSRGRELSFEITWEWVAARLIHGTCEETGLPFFNSTRAAAGLYTQQRNPFYPSLDRIDSNKGYYPDNVRVVLCAVNLAYNNCGRDAFLPIARALAARHSDTNSTLPPTTAEET